MMYVVLVMMVGLLGCIDAPPERIRDTNNQNNGDKDAGMDSDVPDSDAGPDLEPSEITCILSTSQPWVNEPVNVVFSENVVLDRDQATLLDGDIPLPFDFVFADGNEASIRVKEDVETLPTTLTLQLPTESGSVVVCTWELTEFVSETRLPNSSSIVADVKFDGFTPYLLLREPDGNVDKLSVQSRLSLGAIWQESYSKGFGSRAEIVAFPRHDAVAAIIGMQSGIFEKSGSLTTNIGPNVPVINDPAFRKFLSTPTTDTFIIQDKASPVSSTSFCVLAGLQWSCESFPLGPFLSAAVAGERVYLESEGSVYAWDVAGGILFSGVMSPRRSAVAAKVGERYFVEASFAEEQIVFAAAFTSSAPPPIPLDSDVAASSMAFDAADRLFVVHGEHVSMHDGEWHEVTGVTGVPQRNGLGQVVFIDRKPNGSVVIYHPNRLKP